MQHINEKHIDFMLIIENGSNEYEVLKRGNIPSVFSSLMAGINQKIFMIAHTGLISMLMSAAQDKKNDLHTQLEPLLEDLKNAWETKIDSEGDWVLLNPKTLPAGKSLAELGFTKGINNLWDKEKLLITDLEAGKFRSVNIDAFKNLFDEKNTIRKRIFVDAHGSSAYGKKPLLAGMSQDQYFSFLKFLNQNTDFLYLLTCYGGGLNSIKFHDQEIKSGQDAFNALSIKFPIVLGATIEAPTEMSKYQPADYKSFFKLLDEYIKKPEQRTLKEALAVLYKQMGSETGIPLVKFPGSNEFFRAVDLDDTIVSLTMVNMRARELGAKILELTDKQKLLLYPAIVTLPIKIMGSDTKIISMIAGNACHFIDSLSSNRSFQETLPIFNVADASIKVFVIKKLNCKDGFFENILLAKKGTRFKLLAKIISLPQYQKFMGMYVKLESDLDDIDPTNIGAINIFEQPDESGLKIVDPKAVIEQAKISFDRSMPNFDALKQATAGMQTVDMIENSKKEFLNSVGRSIS